MIVASTIALAQALDMRIVAEGVETADDLESLTAMGVDIVQGYHLARPMPSAEVDDWLRAFALKHSHPDHLEPA